MKFSLFYFSGNGSTTQDDKYRLLLEGAKFADQHGFSAVWIPERHFHPFGGLYPNPSVLGAAIAMVTQRVQIRAGSVVMPLQNPLRVAEEWSVVDNLSNGRVGISFASGWNPDDFALCPENYANRKEIMWRDIQTLQNLWEGEPIELQGGAGNLVQVKTFPRPLQSKVPIWVTCLSEETFVEAGKNGVNILTSPLYQSREQIAKKILLYRETLARHGHDPQKGKVVVMMHTFIGEDLDVVKQRVKKPFTSYLKSHFSLLENFIKSLKLPINLDKLTTQDIEDLLAFSFDSYFNGKVLMGTAESCRGMLAWLKEIGVDEIAGLMDFGVEFDWVMESLHHLNKIKDYQNSNCTAKVLLN
jgi:natural product biosynthesis luciferase-like monooxygenase protein